MINDNISYITKHDKIYKISKLNKDTYWIGKSMGDSTHESIIKYAHMILQTT